MQTHTGTHALVAYADEDDNIGLTCVACSPEDFAAGNYGPGDSLTEDQMTGFLQALGLVAEPDQKFIAFMEAVQAGDRETALRLLREHDAETGEFDGEEEEKIVDEMIEGQAQA